MKYTFLIIVGIIIIGFSNLVYLPGSDSLSSFSHLSYNFMQILSLLFIFSLPIWIIWVLVNKEKKKNLKFPLLLLSLSILLGLNSFILVKQFRDYSREYTIDETKELISAIESFKIKNYKYPENLSELTPLYIDIIPNPKIIGIEEFSYTIKDSIYELSFFQNVVLNFNFEVDIYNPIGTQEGEGEMPQLYNTSKENWKYFIFD